MTTEPMGMQAAEELQLPSTPERRLAWFIIHTYSG